MRPWTKSLLVAAFMASWVHQGHAQLPSFLSALYGSPTTTKAPTSRPPSPPARQNAGGQYGPGGRRPPPPPPPPPPHPRPYPPGPHRPPQILLQPRIDIQNQDDVNPFLVSTVNPPLIGNQIITASSPSPNFDGGNFNTGSGPSGSGLVAQNIPLSNNFQQPRQLPLVQQPPFNGVGQAQSPSSFASSPSDFNDDSSWPFAQPDLPKITNIQVQCEKTSIRVNVDFDRPFFGMVFSKGHFSDPSCIHLQPGQGATSTVFEIQLNQCGMTSSGGFQTDNGQPNPAGSFVESTIIVQYDPLVQEVWDQARKLRCTWYDYYEKSVTFRPFQVNMLNAVTANFLGDNLQCWMQVQTGKGPWSSEVSGIVKIGQTMTMVLGIKDEDNKFDMVVRNCVAHDGKRTPIQLVNELGCVIRPKIMSKFNKIKNFGSSATVVSYAYFQAFKFPDSMNVHFQCVIQVCRYNCPDPVCPEDTATAPAVNVQASITAQPAYGGDSLSNSIPSAPDQYVVNPRTPSILPATRRNFRTYGGGGGNNNNRAFNSRSGEYASREGRDNEEIFSSNDALGTSFQHQIYNMNQHLQNNPYYQSYQNHRVKRHEEEMKKTNLGEVKTNSTFMVLSPDDVAFNLGRPKSQNFNDSTIERTNEWTPDYSICVTLTNTSGILFLTFMTIIVVSLTTSAIITWRRCLIKRQKYGNKVKQTVITKLDHRKSSSSKDSSSSNIITKNTAVPPKKLLAEQQKAAEILSNSKSKK